MPSKGNQAALFDILISVYTFIPATVINLFYTTSLCLDIVKDLDLEWLVTAFDQEQEGTLLTGSRNILTDSCSIIPLTAIHLVLDTTTLCFDTATEFDLEWFVTLQHID